MRRTKAKEPRQEGEAEWTLAAEPSYYWSASSTLYAFKTLGTEGVMFPNVL